ncbi:DUF7716 domain-containing protein [Chelativorans salis]|uniref:DUF7716 domain-containing protein n=1 Tax=Chelativorans salis TaxID=2978478 RepID=A0ABT2LN38_9HYPH|nr:hypothetical protein [Chelativorans sp. EGI FJ00035]MCT7375981.1 hypothetical protein [Chelativorans sp. EGI FJ00035]
MADIINALEAQSWSSWVYLDDAATLTGETDVLVIDPDEAELGNDDFTPLVVQEAGYSEFLSIADMQSVVSNLSQQISEPSLDQKIQALQHYFANDAFIRIG